MNTIIFSILIILCSLFFSEKISSQINQEWVNIYSGHGSFTELKGMTINKNSDVYVTGFSHTINGDLYVTRKYSSSGSVLWHDEISSGTYGVPYDITIDDSGYVYITGYYDFSNQDKNIFIIKYSPDGDTVWTKKFNILNSEEIGVSITLDKSRKLLITGWTNNNLITVKYSLDGDYIWHRIFQPPTGYVIPKKIITDDSNNIYCAGVNVYSGSKLFLIKYDSSGNLNWVQYENGDIEGYDPKNMISVDSRNNIYMIGSSQDTSTMGQMLVCKFKSDGNLIRKNTLYSGQCNSLVIDSEDNSYVTGYSHQVSSTDISVFKLDSALNTIWYNNYSQSGNSVEQGRSISLSSNGNVYVLGDGYSSNFTSVITLKYSNNGIFKWIKNYSNGNLGVKVIVNDSNEVFVSGISQYKYVTVKYSGDLTSIGNNQNILTSDFSLLQNYPNPFNPSTVINFTINSKRNVKLIVTDISGKRIKIITEGIKNAGNHSVNFDSRNIPSGIYFYSLYLDNKYADSKRMVFVK